MRLTDSLTLPTSLEHARVAGELVVFAGAGVSIGPPANLPGFVELAREIAEPVVPWDETFREGIDRYLGQAMCREVVEMRDAGQFSPVESNPPKELHSRKDQGPLPEDPSDAWDGAGRRAIRRAARTLKEQRDKKKA